MLHAVLTCQMAYTACQWGAAVHLSISLLKFTDPLHGDQRAQNVERVEGWSSAHHSVIPADTSRVTCDRLNLPFVSPTPTVSRVSG